MNRLLSFSFFIILFLSPTAVFAQSSSETESVDFFDWDMEETYEDASLEDGAQEAYAQTAEDIEAIEEEKRQNALEVGLIEAENLAGQKDFDSAAQLYEELLESEDLYDDDYERVLNAYRQMNYDHVFSKEPSETSVTHTVKSGDSLYVIARKYGTTVGLIKRMNGLKKDVIYPDMKLKIEKGEFSVVVDKSENTLLLLLEDKPIREYVVATGKDGNTPVGTFKITDKLIDPTWYKSGAVIEPDSPENALGTRWLGFDKKGYGIHGTIDPESLGTAASLGCVRMLNAEVEELYDVLPSGAKVTVRN